MSIEIQLKRGLAASFVLSNPVLAASEPSYETDTGKFKIGDGTTAWNSLPYATLKSDPTGITGATAISNVVKISQTNYNALAVKDPDTLYIVTAG